MQAKMKCAIYTRVSTDNQVEVLFNSCEAQAENKKLINPLLKLALDLKSRTLEIETDSTFLKVQYPIF